MNAFSTSQRDEPLSGRDCPLLYNVVYCSQATAGVNGADVDRIVESSKRRNAEQGITGILVFGSGVFFQWLEGPRDNVTQLMNVLRADPRHQNVVQLSEIEEVRERLFPDWDMELVTHDHIREVLLDAQSAAADPKHAETLSLMLAELKGGELSGLGTA